MADNDSEIALEVYRQKYEVFRHFDSLRWQIPTFTLGAGSLLLALAVGKDKQPAWWSFFVFGLLCLFSSFAVFRVRKGIEKNHDALDAAAKYIGDTTIPTPPKHGATWWLSVMLMLFGLALILAGIVLGVRT